MKECTLMLFWIVYLNSLGDGTGGRDGGRGCGGSVGWGVNVGWGRRGEWVGGSGSCINGGAGGIYVRVINGATYGTWTGGDGVGAVEWSVGAEGADVSRSVSWTVLVRPLGRSNWYEKEMWPVESVFWSTCLTIASTGSHHTVDAGQNRGVGWGWRNAIGGFGGGADIVFEVLGGVRVTLVGFEVDGALKLGWVGVEV